MADVPQKKTLLELAADRFGQDILAAEKKLFGAAEKGDWADCGEESKAKGLVRSSRLFWLCTDPNVRSRVTYRGVSICGAEIQGEVNLERANISFPFQTSLCVFKDALILRNSHIVFLGVSITSFEAGPRTLTRPDTAEVLHTCAQKLDMAKVVQDEAAAFAIRAEHRFDELVQAARKRGEIAEGTRGRLRGIAEPWHLSAAGAWIKVGFSNVSGSKVIGELG